MQKSNDCICMIEMADNSPVNTYLRYSIPLAISLYENKTREWLQSSLIQLKCKQDHSQILILLNRIPNLKIKMSLINKRKKNQAKNLIGNITCKISNGYCVSTLLDQFYIPKTPNFNQNHRIHREFIVGYDIEEEKFFLKIYGNEGHIVNSEMSFSDFISAYCWTERVPGKKAWVASVYSYKRKEKIKPKFSYRCFYHSINSYAESKMSLLCKLYTQGLMIIDRENTYKCIYGMKVHEHLADLIYSSYINENLNHIPLIKLDMIYAHKQCMVNRLVFLRDEYIDIVVDKNEFSVVQTSLNKAIIDYKTIEKNYLIYKRLYMKVQQSGNKEELLKIVEGIKNMMVLEKDTLEKLLPYLAILLNRKKCYKLKKIYSKQY